MGDDLIEELIGPWLEKHPHACVALLVPVALSQVHLYWQASHIRKVIKMRAGDGIGPGISTIIRAVFKRNRTPPPDEDKTPS